MTFACPFTPIAAKGLGVSQSSLQQIGEIYQLNGFGQAKLNFFVNVTNGNLIFRDRVIHQQLANDTLDFFYIYNSQAKSPAESWRLSCEKKWIQLPTQGTTAILSEADGQEIIYTYDPNTGYYFAPSVSDGRAYLFFDEAQQHWQWHDPKTKMSEIISLDGRIQQRKDLAGRVTQYSYDSQGRVAAITAPNDIRYEIRRDQNCEEIFVIENGKETLLHGYLFDKSSRLIKSFEPETKYETNYHYVNDTAQLYFVEQSDGSTISLKTEAKKLTSIAFGVDDINTDHIKQANDDQMIVYQIDYEALKEQQGVVITNSNGLKTNLYLDEQQRIKQVEQEQGYNAPLAKELTLYNYHNAGQLAEIIHPNQGREIFEYHALTGLQTLHVKPDGQAKKNLVGIGSSWNYIISRIQYADVARTKPLVTRYIYDRDWDKKGNAILRFEISPEGRVKEYVNTDNWGNPNKVIEYANAYFDVSQMVPEEVPSLEAMQQWVTKHANLQEITLTEQDFDDRGNAKIISKYATVTDKGVGVVDDRMAYEIYSRNSFGQKVRSQIKQQDEKFVVDETKFDGMCRKTRHINALQQETSHTYNDKQSQILTTYPNQQTDQKTYNKSCTVVALEQTAVNSNKQKQIRNFQYQVDMSGHCTVTTQPDGQKIYTIYDRENRLAFTVNAKGIVIGQQYDRANRSTTVTQYSQPIDMGIWLPTEEGFLPSPEVLLWLLSQSQTPQLDIVSYKFSDYSNRLRYQVDADGYITENLYDTRDNIIAQIAYADKVSQDNLNLLKQGKAIQLSFNPEKDRCNRYFFDKDNIKIAEQDAAGYITENKYNAAGYLYQAVHYAKKLPVEPIVEDFKRPVTDDKDTRSYYFNDNRGQCLIEVDGNGFITEHRYLACGLKGQSIRYAKKVPLTWYQNLPVKPVPQASSEDLTTTYQYDELARVIKVTRSDGIEQQTQYDKMGNSIFQKQQDTRKPDSIEASYQRSVQKRYDCWNQLEQVADERVAQLLTEIDADPSKTEEQKRAEKEAVWQEKSLRHTFDKNGLKLASSNCLGTTFIFYDELRRPIITVAANGKIIESTLDIFDQTKEKRCYAAAMPFETLETLKGGVIDETLRAIFDSLKDDANDQITRYQQDKRGNIIETVQPEGHTFKQTINAFRQVEEERIPVASKQPSLIITHGYETRGLEIKTEKTADGKTIKTEKEYENQFGLESKYIDETGNAFRKEYDGVGNLAKLINPNDKVFKTFTRDAQKRLETETDAENNITQHKYNQAERSHTTINPINDSKKVEQTSIFNQPLKNIDAYGKEIASFTYEPGGKLKQEKDSQGHKLSNTYNLLGWQLNQTDKNNVRTDLGYNLDGSLAHTILDADQTKITTQYKRDIFSNANEVTDPEGVITKNDFNKQNKLIQSTVDTGTEQEPGLRLTTQKTYNGLGKELSLTKGDTAYLNQYQKVYERDGFGRVIAEIVDPITPDNPKGLNLKTCYRLDDAGRVIATIDANGNTTRKFYDECGRERYTVDPYGCVSELSYYLTGKKSSEKIYLEKIDPSAISDQMTTAELSKLLNPTANDPITYFYYDANGNERYRINNEGQIYEAQYNNNNQCIAEIEYVNKIDVNTIKDKSTTQIAELVMAKADPKNDKHAYYILNTANHRQYIIHARRRDIDKGSDGIVTKQIFDGQGNVITRTSFANTIELTKLAPDQTPEPFSELITPNPSEDKTNISFYNAFNKQAFTINPKGQVTAYQYDKNGNKTQVCIYHGPIDITQDYNTLRLALLKREPDPKMDQISDTVYDNANRIITEQDALGQTQQYKRDALGNIKTHTNQANQVWEFEHDRANRKTQAISPKVTVTQVEYKDKSLIASEQEQNIITKYGYDAAGNQTITTEAIGTANENISEKYYDKLNRPVGVCLNKVNIDDRTQPANFEKRPENSVDVKTKIVYGAQGKPVVEQDENGNYSFKIYDSAKQLRYTLDANQQLHEKQYDGLGHVTAEIKYATPLSLNITPYITTGIPLDTIEAHRIISTDDQKTTITTNQTGAALETKRSTAFYYHPDKIAAESADFGVAQAITQKQFDSFDNCIVERSLTYSNTWDEKRTWYNRTDKEVATADARQAITRIKRDIFDNIFERIEYAKRLSGTSLAALNLAALDKILKDNTDAKNRVFSFKYDLLNRRTDKTRHNVTYQDVLFDEKNIPTFTDVTRDLTSHTEYNAYNKITSKTYSDDTKRFNYYNALGFEIAKTDRLRATTNDDGEKVYLIPFETYGINALGDKVRTTCYRKGTAQASQDIVPVPIDAQDPDNEITLSLIDNHHCVLWHQDAEQHLTGKTYTRAGKDAREWVLANHGLSIDEDRTDYDNLNQAVKFTTLRDDQVINISQHRYDAFSNLIAKDKGDDSWFYYQKFDALNRCWASNFENGSDIIKLYDIRGRQSATLQSPTKPLNNINYAELSHLLDTSDIEDLYRTESLFDEESNEILKRYPSYQQGCSIVTAQESSEYDSWKNKTVFTDAKGNQTNYDNNCFNKWLQETLPEVYVLDGIKVKKQRPINKRGYNQSGELIATTNPKNATTAKVLNSANQLMYEVRADGTRSITQAVNALSKVVHSYKTDNPQGRTSHFYYNRNGKPRLSIDPLGGVTEWQYAANGKESCYRIYETKVDPKLFTDSMSLTEALKLIQPSEKDSCRYHFYDARRKPRFIVDSQGKVIEKRYNKKGLHCQTIKYDTRIDPTQLQSITTEQLAKQMAAKFDLDKDRVNYYIHDAAGRKRFIIKNCRFASEQDTKGIVIERQYDGLGNKVKSISYANAIDKPTVSAELTEDEFATKLVKDPQQDRVTTTRFNSVGKLLFNISPTGVVTRYEHNQTQKIVSVCKFKRKVAVSDNLQALYEELQTWKPNENDDQRTVYTQDNLDRTIAITDPLTNTDNFVLDANGNIGMHTDRGKNTWLYKHDVLDRLESEIAPPVNWSKVKWDGQKLVLEQVTNKTFETRREYDSENNETAIIEAAGTDEQRVTRKGYNALNKQETSCLEKANIVDPNAPSSFEQRPEQVKDITTSTIYNTKQQPIVEIDEAGSPLFKVYDSENHLIYTINAEGAVTAYTYSTFGQKLSETSYASKLEIDLNQYKTSGIPQDVIEQALKPSVDNDRTTQYRYNQQGWLIEIIEPEIFYYLPAEAEEEPEFGVASPRQRNVFNTFGETILEESLRSPKKNTWIQNWKWRDQEGNILAEVDAQNAVNLYKYSIFGKEVERTEYSAILKETPTLSMTLDELKSRIEKTPGRDRCYKTDYDVAEQKICETSVGVVRQIFTLSQNGKPIMANLPAMDLSKRYTYSPTGKQTSVTLEDDSVKYTYYNARDWKIAETSVTFDSFNDKGGINHLTSLTYYGHNAHGKESMVQRFVNGTDESLSVDKLPLPLQPDSTNDQIELVLNDNRDLATIKSNAQGWLNGFAYTEKGRVARQYWTLTNWVSRGGDKFDKIIHLDDKRINYDLLHRPTNLSVSRDNQAVETTATEYNSFNQAVMEGPEEKDWELLKVYDKKNNVWKENVELSGRNTLHITDLQGNETLKMQSRKMDLDIPYSQLGDVLKLDKDTVERFESKRDNIGRIVVATEPDYVDTVSAHSQDMPLALQVSQEHPAFGEHCLVWTQPPNRNVMAEFSIWPAGQEHLKKQIEIKYFANECGINVSQLPTDIYQYQINYYLRNLDTAQKGELQYTTNGTVQFDTGNSQASNFLVATVEQDHLVYLTGKTDNITVVEVWQNNKLVAKAPVERDSHTGRLYVDLKDYRSGQYTVKPITASQNDLPFSLPFIIYTRQEAEQPLARELYAQLQLLLLDQHAQFIWQLPDAYKQSPIRINCTYLDAKKILRHQKFIIEPGTDLGHYKDKQGKELICNAEFRRQILKIETIDFAVQVANQTWLPLMNQVTPIVPTNAISPVSNKDGFALLETSRQELIDTLLKLADDKTSREALQPEIEDAFISGEVQPPCPLWQKLYSRSLKAKHAITKTLDQIAAKFPSQKNTNQEQLITWLEQNHQQSYAHALRNLQKESSITKRALANYCTTKKAYRHYLSAYSDNRPLSRLTAQLYAKHLNLDEAVLLTISPEQKTGDDKSIVTLDFAGRTILDIRPCPAINDNAEILHYLDTSDSKYAQWRQRDFNYIVNEDTTENVGISIDVSGLPAGIYPYELAKTEIDLNAANSNEFYIGGTQIYRSDSPTDKHHNTFAPTKSFEFDRWNNRLRYTDAMGNACDYEYNDLNQIIKKIKPLVPICLEDGTIIYDHPTAEYGFNRRGFAICKQDENKHTEANVINALGKTLTNILPDGTWNQCNSLDALGRITSYLDARNKRWTQIWDVNNRLLTTISPMGHKTIQGYNENGSRNLEIDSKGHYYRYNTDARGNICTSFLPQGQATQMEYDRNRHLTKIAYPEPRGGVLSWKRNYFGLVLETTDLSGTKYVYEMDYKNQVTRVKGYGDLKHGDWMRINYKTDYGATDFGFEKIDYFQPVREPTPQQDIIYTYQPGNRLVELYDVTSHRKTLYTLDREKRRTQVLYKTDNDILIKKIQSRIDALGRGYLNFDNNMMMETGYDAASNRRFMKSKIFGRDGKSVLESKDLYYIFDENNWVNIDGGILENGVIKITPWQGVEMKNIACKRISEKIGFDGVIYETNLQYNDDGLLTDTTGGRPYVNTHRDYLENNTQYRYIYNVMDTVIFRQEQDYNDNGWTLADTSYLNNKIIREYCNSRTVYKDHSGTGVPLSQVTQSRDVYDNVTTDYLSRNDIGFSNWELSRLGGYRENKYGRSAYNCVQKLYGPNGYPSGVVGADKSKDNFKIIQDTAIENSPDGLILNKQYYITRTPISTEGQFGTFLPINKECFSTTYFYTVNGDYEASYNFGHNEDDIAYYSNGLVQKVASYAFFQRLGEQAEKQAKAYELRAKRMPNFMLANDFSRSIVKDMGHGILGLGQQSYTVAEGDTFESIAQKEMHDTRYAADIARANHSVAESDPEVGQTLHIPQYIPSFNGASTSIAYAQFRAIMVGSVYPHLDTPQPHDDDDDDWFSTLITMVVVIVVASVVPGAMAPLLHGLSDAVAMGIAAGVSSAVAQGVCIAIGVQHSFDLVSVLEAAVTAGLMHGMGLNMKAKEFLSMDRIVKYGALNTAMQLADMAAGRRDRFDPNAVLMAITNGLTRDLIIAKTNLPDFERDTITSVSQSITNGAVFHEPVRMDQVMASALGTAIGTAAGTSLKQALKLPDLMEYRQAHQEQAKQQQRAAQSAQEKPAMKAAADNRASSSNDPQKHNQTRSQAWLKRQRAINDLVKDDLEWKADYIMQAPKDAGSRFTQWQQEAEQANSLKGKWDRFEARAEVLRKGLLAVGERYVGEYIAEQAGYAGGVARNEADTVISIVDTIGELSHSSTQDWHNKVQPIYDINQSLGNYAQSSGYGESWNYGQFKSDVNFFLAKTYLEGEIFGAVAGLAKGTELIRGLTAGIDSKATQWLNESKWTGRFFGNRNKDLEGINVYHTVTSKKNAHSVLNKIDPYHLNPESRFGQAFYASEIPDTTLAELAHHNTMGVETIRFEFNSKSAKVLDLTNVKIAESWGYSRGDITISTRNLGEKAASAGFDVIRYPSERGAGANIAVLKNFDEILKPQMIVPTPRMPNSLY